MQVFKTALRVFFKHPVYILVYLCLISFMAVFIGSTVATEPTTATFDVNIPDIAIIDRDQSELSKGLSDFASRHSNIIEVEDDLRSLQDAAAQDYADYILIIPEGFHEDFIHAAQNANEFPVLETITSYESLSARLMNELVNEYLSTVSTYLSTETTNSLSSAIAFATSDMEKEASVEVIQQSSSVPVSQQWILYMQFSGYTIMLSITICIGVVMAAFNRTEIRRRDFTSPLSSLFMNLQIAAAAVVITLICWIWVSILGLVVFGSSLESVDPGVIGTALLSLLCYCTVPLAIGFFLGIITTSELVVNAVGNIIGLAFSFLSGIWIGVELMNDTLLNIAHFVPTFYYRDAISQVINLKTINAEALAPVFADLGIILLFSAAIFAIALVAGRLRVQSAEAGGNAAAAVVRR